MLLLLLLLSGEVFLSSMLGACSMIGHVTEDDLDSGYLLERLQVHCCGCTLICCIIVIQGAVHAGPL